MGYSFTHNVVYVLLLAPNSSLRCALSERAIFLFLEGVTPPQQIEGEGDTMTSTVVTKIMPQKIAGAPLH